MIYFYHNFQLIHSFIQPKKNWELTETWGGRLMTWLVRGWKGANINWSGFCVDFTVIINSKRLIYYKMEIVKFCRDSHQEQPHHSPELLVFSLQTNTGSKMTRDWVVSGYDYSAWSVGWIHPLRKKNTRTDRTYRTVQVQYLPGGGWLLLYCTGRLAARLRHWRRTAQCSLGSQLFWVAGSESWIYFAIKLLICRQPALPSDRLGRFFGATKIATNNILLECNVCILELWRNSP